MNSVEEIKIIRRRFQYLLEDCNSNEDLDDLLEEVQRPYNNAQQLMKDIYQQIDMNCSDEHIKKLGFYLDGLFIDIINSKGTKHLEGTKQRESWSKPQIDILIDKYNRHKMDYDLLVVKRRELQCKYSYLKKALPKIQRLVEKLEKKIMEKRL